MAVPIVAKPAQNDIALKELEPKGCTYGQPPWLFEPILNKCVLLPKHHRAAKFAEILYCSKRPVLHCWHAFEGKDFPVCCWCGEEAHLPPISGLIEEGIFSAFVDILNDKAYRGCSLKKDGKAPVLIPLGKTCQLISIGQEKPFYSSSHYPAFLHTIDKSGIRRLYVPVENGDPGSARKIFARVLQEREFLKHNMSLATDRRFDERKKPDLLSEIKAQAAFLPEKIIENRSNRKTLKIKREIESLQSRISGKRGARG